MTWTAILMLPKCLKICQVVTPDKPLSFKELPTKYVAFDEFNHYQVAMEPDTKLVVVCDNATFMVELNDICAASPMHSASDSMDNWHFNLTQDNPYLPWKEVPKLNVLDHTEYNYFGAKVFANTQLHTLHVIWAQFNQKIE